MRTVLAIGFAGLCLILKDFNSAEEIEDAWLQMPIVKAKKPKAKKAKAPAKPKTKKAKAPAAKPKAKAPAKKVAKKAPAKKAAKKPAKKAAPKKK